MRSNNNLTPHLRHLLLLVMMTVGTGTVWAQTTYTYYALHVDGKGYLKQAKGTVSNDATFRYEDTYNDNGSSIWVLSSDGYLQQEMYYLNVINDQTLCLSTTPVTIWDLVDDGGKMRLQMHGSTKILGLNSSDKPILAESPAKKYTACTLTVTEMSWTADPEGLSFTVQSPQLVTYLRTYFKWKIDVVIDKNDKGETDVKVIDNKDSRCYCKLVYNTTSDANKGTKWDINTDNGVIYSKQNNDITVVATYDVAPLNPIVLADHPSSPRSVSIKIQKKAFAPNALKKYLLFNTQENNYRFPHVGSASEDDFLPVDGKQSNLTEAINEDLSWEIECDDTSAEGYYYFKNVSTGQYLYYDADDYTLSDFGAVKVGATTLPTDNTKYKYKFRLFSGGVSRDPFGTCFYIIPYDKQFAVFSNTGVLGELYFAIYVNKTPTPKIASLYKASDNAKWKIYSYEWQYRLWDDYAISGEQNIYTAGEHTHTASTWFSRNIKESPSNTEYCLLPGSKVHDGITYTWEVSGLDASYISTTDNFANGTSTLTSTITLPPGTRTGTLKVTAKITSPANISKSKEIPLTLYNLNPSFTDIEELSQITNENGLYRLTADNTYSSTNKPAVTTFSGTLTGKAKENGTFPVISNLTQPLFTIATSATICNIIIQGGTTAITSESGPVGAICGTADGLTRIYNCGVLSGIVSGSTYVGGIVGQLSDNARVINCYSFAEVRGGTVAAGIVGCIPTKVSTATINNESIDIAIDQSHVTTAPMVMNCMFYGDITSGTKKYPVYGGSMIRNDGTGSVNGYNYYRQNIYDKAEKDYIDNVTFDDDYSNVNKYNRSWPAEEQYLTRFEYYRSILNSNRRLCTWWVGGSTAGEGKAPNDSDVEAVGIAKWVLDPEIAPYPVLKKWGKYSSVINPDITRVWDTENQQWQSRSTAIPYRGKSFSTTFSVKINPGDHKASGLNEITKDDFVITDMDTLNYDYGYYKIQLPYYNEIFGNPETDDWISKYGGNYTDYVVTGWEITKVNGGTKGTFIKADDATTGVRAWESGFNYADRYCTDKDLYSEGERVFAQGGYYYVPEGVTDIEIKAHWGKAFYLHGKDHALDRVNVTNSKNYGSIFSPAGTLPTKITYNDGTEKAINIYDDFNTIMTEVKKNKSCTVYDQAIVLVGNFPLHAQNDIGLGNSGEGGFTIMSADFDMDNEPDFCLPLQWRSDYTRLPIMPVRFDFLPIPELGLTMRHNTYAYAIGIFVPQGHFEITETSFMHTTQFEYMSPNTNVNINHQQPLILNGGQFEQIVCHGNKNNKPQIGNTRNIILGGNVWMRRFTPGSHSGQYAITRHCAISVMGGDFPEFYLTGLYWTGLTTSNAYNDNPHCYINGGRFGIIAGAGMEAVKNSVYFEIDHSVIDEFYGGGINANNPVAGDIHVTINNSIVNDIFCGGPKVGTCQTITTNAKGTTFNRYFGGGNGGTNLYREGIADETPTNMPDETAWRGNTYKFDNFKPITDFDAVATYNPQKGFHAEFEFEVFNQSNGINNSAVARTYRHWAQFGVTETGNVTSILEDCTFKHNFYGGGNLATVTGNVTSTLKGTTTVAGSAFGAGFSASVPSFSVHDRSKTTFPTRDASGVCHNGKVEYLENSDGTIRKYTWCYKDPTTNIVTPAGVVIPESGISLTDNTNDNDYTSTKPVFQYNGEWYCLTKVPLDNLGTVTGNVTLNIEGNTEILGNVFGGGDEGLVEGSTEVNIE